MGIPSPIWCTQVGLVVGKLVPPHAGCKVDVVLGATVGRAVDAGWCHARRAARSALY